MPGEQLTSVVPEVRKQLRDLPLEAGRARVQRLVDELPALHIETAPPECERWTLTVDGLVEQPCELTLAQLQALETVNFVSDFHCVWGWSKPRINWTGTPTGALLDMAGAHQTATHVRFGALDSPYVACVPLAQARDGLLAFGLEGEGLDALHGGPLRWLQPHYLWGYKGVKWLSRITLLDHDDPGPWEEMVGDTEGIVPAGILDRFAKLETIEAGQDV